MEVKGMSQGGQTAQELVCNSPIGELQTQKSNGNTPNLKSDTNEKISEKDVKKAVDKLNNFLKDEETHAEYSYHDKLKYDLMIKIVDNKTGETIQEIPSKKILDMIAKMCELVGVLMDKKA